MAETEARPWWAEVEHLREDLARRREAERSGFDRVARRPGGRFVEGQRSLVDAELSQLASPSGRVAAREDRGITPRRRTGRFDRGDSAHTPLGGGAPADAGLPPAGGRLVDGRPLVDAARPPGASGKEPEAATSTSTGVLLVTPLDPAPEPPAPRPATEALLALDVPGWQEPRRRTRTRAPAAYDAPSFVPGVGEPGRRTVQVRGRGAEGRTEGLLAERARRRPNRSAAERVGPRPDRIALWALLLGFVLIVTAVATADAATLSSRGDGRAQGAALTAPAAPGTPAPGPWR